MHADGSVCTVLCAGPRTPPKYCRLWTGVSCDSGYQITGLNLTALNIQMPSNASLALSTVIDRLQPLSATLRSLDAAALQLSGELPATLATFSRLEHLDLSGNKAVKGSLPSIWAALVALRTLDISSTGISGSLPASWASLQKLRAFRAADCSGLSGQLPLEWGMLKSLEELVVINSQLSGPLPAWTDAEMLRAASTAALATAQQAVDQAVNEDLVVASVQQRVRYISGAVSPQAVVEAASCAASALQSALAAAPASTRFMPLRIINLSGNNLSGQLVPNWSLFEQLQVSYMRSAMVAGSRMAARLFLRVYLLL